MTVETADKIDSGHVGAGKVVDGRGVDKIQGGIPLQIEG